MIKSRARGPLALRLPLAQNAAQMEQETPRQRQRQHWVRERLGGSEFGLEPASEDASFRSYWRVSTGGRSYILMDAPPAREDSRPFVKVAEKLLGAGLHAPRLYEIDLDAGFLLLEDLGSTLYADVLDESTAPHLYRDALDALGSMQKLACGDLPPYDEALLRTEMSLFRDWLLIRHLGRKPGARFAARWEELQAILVANALQQPVVFVHRDYHCRNLLVCESRNPGIVDFQDAVAGPITYDLVSLLRDCYLAWPPEQVQSWAEDYRRRACAGGSTTADRATWKRWFDLTGFQRQLKAAGIFCRLWHRDGKPGYLKDIPRTLGYARAVCAGDARFRWFGELLDEIAPELDQRAQDHRW